MTEAELQTLKANINKNVRVVTSDGEEMVVKVISVFDRESDPDMFYELVSTPHSHLYPRKERVGGYSIPLKEILSVKAVP
jgi:hypothetical protein